MDHSGEWISMSTKSSMISLAGFIDHTLLKPEATAEKITQLCAEAKQYHFWSVCVNPTHVRLCAELLKDSGVKVCTVIGFPLGANTTAVKVFEAKTAIEEGANEVDMVINIGALKAGKDDQVLQDIHEVVSAAHANAALAKVIIETVFLSDDEKVKACQLAKKAGADFVKTSTGFSGGGANVHDIALMRRTVGPEMGVKASGGVHNLTEASALVAAGASRIGASAGVKIMQEEAGIVTAEPGSSSKGY
jgi:deoxyribose-phosphate aldolase